LEGRGRLAATAKWKEGGSKGNFREEERETWKTIRQKEKENPSVREGFSINQMEMKVTLKGRGGGKNANSPRCRRSPPQLSRKGERSTYPL